MAERRLIDASALRERIEGWMQELEQEFTVEYAYMGYALDDVLDYIDTAPTVQHECICQKWHPASEIPPLRVDVCPCCGEKLEPQKGDVRYELPRVSGAEN